MKVFRELHVRADDATLRSLVEKMEAALRDAPGEWRRERTLEDRLRERMATSLLCFSGAIPGTSRRALVWLGAKPGSLDVTNIVPEQSGSFEYDEYNNALTAFHDALVLPASRDASVVIELGDASFEPSDTLGPHVAQLLEDFAETANRSTGASHPSDNARWRAFVIAAHREKVAIESDLLERWLREDAGFPPEVSYDLAARYENERALLRQFEQSAA